MDRENILNYMVDSMGYAEEDLEDWNTIELLDMVDSMDDLKKFTE